MINYIFSDKTGTLTQNIMEFKKFSVGNFSYGTSNPGPQNYEPGVTNVNFECPLFEKHWNKDVFISPLTCENPMLADYMDILAVCHTIVVDKKNDRIVYNASSPDELALINGARHFGIMLMERDTDDNVVVYNKLTQKTSKFKILNVLEFTSARKRMTVVVRDDKKRILVMMKGADSIIIPRLAPGQEELIDQTKSFLLDYANEGLRTLLLGVKVMSERDYNQWNNKYR